MCSRRGPADVFGWIAVFLLGSWGPSLLGSWLDRCVFTWPVCLYVAFHLTLRTGLWAEQASHVPWARWAARAALLALLLVGYGYLGLCRTIGLFIAWSFLFGFLFAFPLPWLAARAEVRRKPCWQRAVWSVAGFGVFFWSGQALLVWKGVG